MCCGRSGATHPWPTWWWTPSTDPGALCARQPAQAPRAHPAAGSLAWTAYIVFGLVRSRAPQRLAMTGHGRCRAARSHSGPRHAHDSTDPASAADTAGTEAWRTVSPVRVHSPAGRASMSLGVAARTDTHSTGPSPPPTSPISSHARCVRRAPWPSCTTLWLEGQVPADFERLRVPVTARASRRWASGRTRRRRRI